MTSPVPDRSGWSHTLHKGKDRWTSQMGPYFVSVEFCRDSSAPDHSWSIVIDHRTVAVVCAAMCWDALTEARKMARRYAKAHERARIKREIAWDPKAHARARRRRKAIFDEFHREKHLEKSQHGLLALAPEVA